jgi:nitrite reductase/ring-hydroxylating ferredoxin subunit
MGQRTVALAGGGGPSCSIGLVKSVPSPYEEHMVKVKACLVSELPPHTMRNISLLGRTVLIANVGDRVYAMDGLCSSDGANLADGVLRGYLVKCPIHGSEFDLRTGKVVKGPWGDSKPAADLRSYAVVREGDCLYVDMT